MVLLLLVQQLARMPAIHPVSVDLRERNMDVIVKTVSHMIEMAVAEVAMEVIEVDMAVIGACSVEVTDKSATFRLLRGS